VIAFNNYATWLWFTAGADAALPVYDEGIEFVERRGGRAAWHRGESTWPLFDTERWDELLERARLVEEDGAGGQPALMALSSKGRVLFYRGQTSEAAAIASDLLPRARAAADPQIVLPALSLAALGEPRSDVVLALLTEMLEVDAPENPLYPDSARVLLRHGSQELAHRMIRTDERAAPRARHVAATVRAILAEHAGDAAAAQLYDGGVPERIEEARGQFRARGATPLEREAAELLDRVAA
jgi:hypothetical protein